MQVRVGGASPRGYRVVWCFSCPTKQRPLTLVGSYFWSRAVTGTVEQYLRLRVVGYVLIDVNSVLSAPGIDDHVEWLAAN